ncbi:hypothetical protein [Patulibacter minatonensis]|uniref:hypothetical protein n=1 Tax=Patulibacter minatonensis TaxID=298163 RepID=UPI00047C9736|nr:hypothetical protein [Patulibacter minatonensis]
MRVRIWVPTTAVAAALSLTAVLALSSRPGDAQGRETPNASRTATEDGIRWRFDGRSVVVTATDEAPAAVRRRLSGDLSIGCTRVPLLGSRAKLITGAGAARFADVPGTVRVRLAPRITRADSCFIERKGDAEDVASVRFPADAYASTSGGAVPSGPERAAIVAGLVRYFDAVIADDREAECASYTEDVRDAVAAYHRRFVKHPSRVKDCVSAYRELARDLPSDAVGIVPVDAQAVRRRLRDPSKLDIRVKHGRARVSRTGTVLDFGFELTRSRGRWLIDRKPGIG